MGTGHLTSDLMRNCTRCRKTFFNHSWVVDNRDFCGPWCQREADKTTEGGHKVGKALPMESYKRKKLVRT